MEAFIGAIGKSMTRVFICNSRQGGKPNREPLCPGLKIQAGGEARYMTSCVPHAKRFEPASRMTLQGFIDDPILQITQFVVQSRTIHMCTYPVQYGAHFYNLPA